MDIGNGLKLNKPTGIAFTLHSLVHGLLWLALVVSAITLFMCFVLNWSTARLGGIYIGTICSWALRASIIIGLAYNVIFNPIAALAKKSFLRTNLTEDMAGDGEEGAYMASFMGRLLGKLVACITVAGILTAAIAFLAHDFVLMDMLGNPATDIITIAIILVGPFILNTICVNVSCGGMKRENEALYNFTLDLLLQMSVF